MRMARLAFCLALLGQVGVGAVVWAQEATTAPKGREAPASVETEESPAAQSEAGPQGTPTGQPPATRGRRGLWGDQTFIFILIGGVILMWLFLGRGRRKEQQRRRQMLETLKKGDRVSTIGGILGTIVDIKENEVTLKVDESANVRMKFLRRAIHEAGELGKAEGGDQQREKK